MYFFKKVAFSILANMPRFGTQKAEKFNGKCHLRIQKTC